MSRALLLCAICKLRFTTCQFPAQLLSEESSTHVGFKLAICMQAHWMQQCCTRCKQHTAWSSTTANMLRPRSQKASNTTRRTESSALCGMSDTHAWKSLKTRIWRFVAKKPIVIGTVTVFITVAVACATLVFSQHHK